MVDIGIHMKIRCWVYFLCS